MKKPSNNLSDYPDVDLMFPSKYVKSAEVKAAGRPIPLTIVRIEPRHELQTTRGGKEYKPALFFKETDKGVVMNKTNANRLKDCFGPDPRKWIGKRVVFCVERVDGFGKKTDGLRVDADKTEAANQGRAPEPPQQEQESGWSQLRGDADEQALADAAREAGGQ